MTAAAFDLAARALCRMAQNGDTDVRKALDQEAPWIDAATDYAAEQLCRATLDCARKEIVSEDEGQKHRHPSKAVSGPLSVRPTGDPVHDHQQRQAVQSTGREAGAALSSRTGGDAPVAQYGGPDVIPAHGGILHFRARGRTLKCRW